MNVTNGENGSPVDTYQSIESWRLVVLNPQSFTQTLTDIGYNVVHTMPFGDHHNFEMMML